MHLVCLVLMMDWIAQKAVGFGVGSGSLKKSDNIRNSFLILVVAQLVISMIKYVRRKSKLCFSFHYNVL